MWSRRGKRSLASLPKGESEKENYTREKKKNRGKPESAINCLSCSCELTRGRLLVREFVFVGETLLLRSLLCCAGKEEACREGERERQVYLSWWGGDKKKKKRPFSVGLAKKRCAGSAISSQSSNYHSSKSRKCLVKNLVKRKGTRMCWRRCMPELIVLISRCEI